MPHRAGFFAADGFLHNVQHPLPGDLGQLLAQGAALSPQLLMPLRKGCPRLLAQSVERGQKYLPEHKSDL